MFTWISNIITAIQAFAWYKNNKELVAKWYNAAVTFLKGVKKS